MPRNHCLCLAAVIPILAGTCPFAGAAGPPGASVALPANPRAAVIELEFEGQSRVAVSRAAFLRIEADGMVHAPDPSGAARTIVGRLSSDELQALLRELIVTDGLFTLQSRELLTAIEDQGRRTRLEWRIADADTTVLRVVLADRSHEVRCAGVSLLCERFPKLASLQQLGAAQRRLQNIAAVVQVGGHEEAERLAKLATRELRSQDERAPLVTPRDLTFVRASRDGLRYAQFDASARWNGAESEHLIVSVVETPREAPRISVSAAVTARK